MLSSLLPIWGSRHTDIIFAMNQNFFAFFPSLIYKILLNKRIIRNVDDLWPEVFYDLKIPGTRILRRVLDYAAWLSYRIPSAIIPVSEGYVPTLTTKYHIPKEKIHVIEHGVDTRRFDDPEFKNSSSKEGKKIIMYSGNLNIGYDFDIVFACAKLLELEPVHFIIRGTGELSERLKQMVAEYGLENLDVRIELLSQKELNSVLSSAHVFLLPMSSVSVSADQGLPTKVLEYQALGRPIVCISDGEAGAYITRTQSGLVSKTRTPEELARLIMNLVNDDSLAKELGSNGFQHIRKNLTLDLVGKRIMSVITKC
jgi:N,N'-diacetylbacillosaminyl-diphospho-undecaprenol alpha-1,3-N-acetylgalactosaminyltransferase